MILVAVLNTIAYYIKYLKRVHTGAQVSKAKRYCYESIAVQTSVRCQNSKCAKAYLMSLKEEKSLSYMFSERC